MEEIRWERLASIAVCLTFLAAILFFCARFLLSFLFPFLAAWVIAVLIRPLAARVAVRFRLPRKLCAVILLILFYALLIFIVVLSSGRLLEEAEKLITRLLEAGASENGRILPMTDYFEQLTSGIGFLRQMEAGDRFAAFRESFNDAVNRMLSSLLTSVSARLPELAGRWISALPSFLFSAVVTVVAGFYFCMEPERIGGALVSVLPRGIRQRIPLWKSRMKHLSWRYLRAYLVLFLLTALELFTGFSVLRIEYAFLLSLLIAFVDLLPVLGVGTVLIPWSLILLIQRNFYQGFGLLILFLVSVLVRQIIEPRLVGKSLGLHPLLTLAAGFAGWKLLGVVGMLLGPFAALLMKAVSVQLIASGGEKNADLPPGEGN